MVAGDVRLLIGRDLALAAGANPKHSTHSTHYLDFMTIERARSSVPARVIMQPVLHSESLNKREWGYDSGSRKAYVIFGAPGKPISLYEYLNVASAEASSIQMSTDDSQAITDFLVLKKKGTKLYPVS